MANTVSARERLFTRRFITISAVSLISNIYSVMLMTTVLMYGGQMGYGEVRASVLTASFAFASLLFRPFSGPTADIGSKKRLCAVSFVLYAIAPVVLLASDSFTLGTTARILSGAAMALSSTALSAIASQTIPKSRFTEGIGYYGIGMTLGGAVAPAIGLELIERLGYEGMFTVSSAMSMVALVLTLTIPETRQGGEQGPRAALSLRALAKGIYEKTAVFASASTLLTSGAQISLTQLLPFYAAQKGVGDVSGFFVLSAAGVLVPRVFSGALKRRWSDKALLNAGYLALLATYLCLYLTDPEGPVFIMTAVLYGLGQGLSSMVLNSMAVIDAPPEKVGAANATYWMAGDMSYAVFPVAWGAYCGERGYSDIYLVSSGMIAVSFIAFLLRCGYRNKN